MSIRVHSWLTSLLVALALAPAAHAQNDTALPTGGQIAAGTGTLATNGATLTVQQTSPTLAVNWQSFDIGADATVNFVQPSGSSVALNRVLGADASQIYGKLNANGQVFLVNPNGILFGRTAQVNVGGLVASTLDLSDADFLAGRRRFSGTPGAVTNHGTLNGGYVALLGGQVSNQGTIAARLGTVALAAGSDITLDFAGDGLLGVQVNRGALDALAENRQLIRADGGNVLLTAHAADRLVQAVVNNTGVIEARTLENRGGTIKLLGDMQRGTVNVAGTLDASAPESGDGGFIETSAAHVKIADDAKITTKSATGSNGTWLIDPTDFTIASSGGDISGATLSTNLGAGNVTIYSTLGGAGTAGDVNVNDSVTWSANTLTLDALNNININAQMNGSGTAGLALVYGRLAPAAGNTATYNVHAPVNLASTGSFSTKLGSDGAVKNYTILTSLGAAGSTTGTDLQGMAGNLAGNYVLGANIDATATSSWNAGAGFVPVGWGGSDFLGVFDGLGHTISGLTINRPSTDRIALFGNIRGATLRNVGLVGAQISGRNEVGTLAAYVSNGDISHSYVEGGSVTGNNYVGGLVGQLSGNASGAQISNSYTSTTVSGVSGVGGLVGFNWNAGIISDSYATGAISGNLAVGGLVGVNRNIVTTSYSSGAVSGSSQVGGLVGLNSSGAGFSGNVSNSYWDIGTSGQASGVGFNNGTPTVTNLVGLATADAYTRANYANLDFTNTWWMSDGNTRPFLRSEYSTTITNVHQLQLMEMGRSSSYTLGNDIDASQTSAAGSGMWTGAGFVPVGTNIIDSFTGNFDGRGFSVSDLFIDRPTTDYVGLFGVTHGGATVANIVVDGGSIRGNDRVGGLVGFNLVASIENAETSVAVTATGVNAGGVVGENWGDLKFSGASGTVNGVGNGVGGLVGANYKGEIEQCFATGTVSGTGDNVGGLVGLHQGLSGNSITGSYATGAVTGNASVGGLVGFQTGNVAINNTYATGSVTGTDRVGGLVGSIDDLTATITNSYATGSVSGTAHLGGLVGLPLSTGAITGSYFNSASPDNGIGTAKTTAELKSLATFAGWDIDDAGGTGKVWRIYDGSTTPLLRGFLTTLTASPTYDGSGAALSNITAYTIAGTYDAAKVLGTPGSTLTLSSTAANGYTATLGKGLYSTQQGYDLVASRTISTPGSAAGDIALSAPISWTSGTLAINTTGTITPTAAINGTGTAIFDLQAGTWRQVAATLPAFAAYDFRISGGSFVRALGGDGTVGTPYQLADVYGLQGMGSSGMLGLNYTLANNVDATATANWNAGAGFVPVGNSAANFTGSFDGLGHAVTGLTINRPDWLNAAHFYQGLFGYAGAGSTLHNVGLLNSSIYGAMAVGTLAGRSDGAISNSYADGGSVTTSVSVAGGLVGALGGSINNSYANVSVSGAGAGGAVSSSIGGLVGLAFAGSSISDSYAAGSVSAGDVVGGLVGQNHANITNSYASGAVTATARYRGGFIGDQLSGTVTNSYWDSATTGLGSIGGVSSGGGGTVTSLTDISAAPYAQASYTGFDFTNTWRIYEGYTRPLLKSFLTALTVTATNASRTYDGTAYSGGNGVTYSIAPNANLLGTVNYSGTSQGATNAGSYVLTPGGLYSNQRGYDIAYANGSLVIDPRVATLTGTRTYDGTTAIAGSGLSLGNLVIGDTVTLTGSGTLASRNAGAQSLASVGTFALSNTNYTLTGATGSVTITPATLTLTASTDTKTYDGATTSTGTVTVAGLIAGDTLSGLTQSYASKNVLGASGSTLTVNSGYTLADGNSGNNYTVTTTNATGTITPAALTLAASTGTKTYDGTTASSGTVNVTGLVAGDTLSGLTQSYASKNVLGANGSTLAVNSDYTLTDGNGGVNYTVTTATAAGTIDPRAVTFTGTRTYDGTTAIAGSVLNLGNLVSGDTVAATGSGTLSSRNAGTQSLANVSTLALDNANYTLTGATGNVTITPAALTLTASTDTKTYDGTTTSTGTVNVTGLAAGDTLTGLTQSYGSKNVLGTNGSTLTVNSGYTLADGNAGANYTVTTATAAGTITPAALTLTANSDTKTYDGTTTSTGTVNATGLAAGDTLTALTQSYTNKNALGANGSTLTVNSGYTLADGNGGANYTVTTASAAGTITPAALTLAASSATKTYDGTTASSGTVNVTGLIAGDTLTGLTQSYANKNVLGANGSTLTVNSGYTLADGNGGANYTVTTASAAGTITPAALTLTASAATKTYDGTTASTGTVNATGLAAGDTLTGLTQSYASKNVLGANGSTLTVNSGYTLADGNAGNNYTVTTTNAAGTITPATLTLAANSATKTYDGTTTSAGTVNVTGLIAGDTLSGLTQSYTNKNVLGANGSTLTVNSGYTLADGNSGNNYTVTTTNATGTITPAALTLAAATATKVYDGTTTSAGTVNATGLVAGDTLSGLTQSYASKNVLGTNGSTLIVNGGYTLADGNAGANYAVTTASAAGTITPAALTLAASTGTKTYDGTTTSTGAVNVTGLIAGDTLTGLTQSYTNKNARGANGSTLTVNSGYTLGDGNSGANYTVTTATATGTIDPRVVTLTGTRAFDDTRNVAGSTLSATNLAPGDSLTVSGNTTIAGSALGTYELGNLGTLALDNANYTLSGATGRVTIVAPPTLDPRSTPVLVDVLQSGPGFVGAPGGNTFSQFDAPTFAETDVDDVPADNETPAAESDEDKRRKRKVAVPANTLLVIEAGGIRLPAGLTMLRR